jgi:hypothetical protein
VKSDGEETYPSGRVCAIGLLLDREVEPRDPEKEGLITTFGASDYDRIKKWWVDKFGKPERNEWRYEYPNGNIPLQLTGEELTWTDEDLDRLRLVYGPSLAVVYLTKEVFGMYRSLDNLRGWQRSPDVSLRMSPVLSRKAWYITQVSAH